MLTEVVKMLLVCVAVYDLEVLQHFGICEDLYFDLYYDLGLYDDEFFQLFLCDF